ADSCSRGEWVLSTDPVVPWGKGLVGLLLYAYVGMIGLEIGAGKVSDIGFSTRSRIKSGLLAVLSLKVITKKGEFVRTLYSDKSLPKASLLFDGEAPIAAMAIVRGTCIVNMVSRNGLTERGIGLGEVFGISIDDSSSKESSLLTAIAEAGPLLAIHR
ncbi:hypothetical protein Tco_0867340, partial [Tanacetum coccineum]